MMPQLDFTTFSSQFFWLAVNFVLLYFLLAKLALPRVGKMIEARAASIKADIHQASKLQSDAEATLLQYDKAIADAKSRAKYLLKQAQDEVQLDHDKQLGALDQKLNARLRDAENKITASKNKVLQELTPMSQDLARHMVQKLLAELGEDGKTNVRPIKAIG